MFRILAIVATLLGSASVAQADVYRWTDANGTVQYSDRWVPGSVRVKTDSGQPVDSDSNTGTEPSAPVSPPPENTDPAVQQESERTVQQDMARVKAERCKQVREQYDRAMQSRRIYRENEQGQRVIMSDPEADAYRVELLNRRKQACGS